MRGARDRKPGESQPDRERTPRLDFLCTFYDVFHVPVVKVATHAESRRECGCDAGLVEVLHTWGQHLGMHVHIHVVMTAGGLTPEEDRWVPISADDDVMSREVLAAKFRKT